VSDGNYKYDVIRFANNQVFFHSFSQSNPVKDNGFSKHTVPCPGWNPCIGRCVPYSGPSDSVAGVCIDTEAQQCCVATTEQEPECSNTFLQSGKCPGKNMCCPAPKYVGQPHWENPFEVCPDAEKNLILGEANGWYYVGQNGVR
jgi:hypothetical protein